MDVARFKLLSGSMRDAFGVQAIVEARTMPKGTSIVAQEFSPGVPDATALNVINQFTVDSNRNTLDILSRRSQLINETQDHARRIREALREEIEKGSVAVETEEMKIIIRILENASFDSGYADVRTSFVPILARIGTLLERNSGMVTVSGHTDNVPIGNERFRSNWELSTSRAVSVTHELLKTAELEDSRFVVTGHAETQPRAANDSEENRARNRRVEISIVRGHELDTLLEMTLERSSAAAASREEFLHE